MQEKMIVEGEVTKMRCGDLKPGVWIDSKSFADGGKIFEVQSVISCKYETVIRFRGIRRFLSGDL